MRNIIDFEQVKWDRKTQSYREYVRSTVERIRDCGTEEPAYSHGLNVVADSFEKYLDTLMDASEHTGAGSTYWDTSCTLSFNRNVENDILTSIYFTIFNGRAVERVDVGDMASICQGTISLTPKAIRPGFTKYHNVDPVDVFNAWLDGHNKRAGVFTLYSINTVFFEMLFRTAGNAGFKLDDAVLEGDKLHITFNGQQQLVVMIDYAKFKSTHDIFIKKLHAAQNQSNTPEE